MMTIEALQSNLVEQCFKVSEVALRLPSSTRLNLRMRLLGGFLSLMNSSPWRRSLRRCVRGFGELQ